MNLRKILTFAICAAFLWGFSSCKDSKSYAELLNEETKSVNSFLADQNVILDIPADSVFEYGFDAPFYRIDPDGNVFMQVIDPGEAEKVKDDALVFFRFTRYNLNEYALTGESIPVEKHIGDKVIGATTSKSGYFKMQATKVGDDTTLAQIVRLVDEATSSKAPIAKLADKVSGVFVPVVITLSLIHISEPTRP